jgi:hypothetical protein
MESCAAFVVSAAVLDSPFCERVHDGTQFRGGVVSRQARKRVRATPGRRTTISGGSSHLGLHWSLRQHRGDMCHVTGQVGKASLPRRGAKERNQLSKTLAATCGPNPGLPAFVSH